MGKKNPQLNLNAQKIVEKTILAADESSGTIKKRFDKIGVESTPEKNREYRLLLFETPGIEKYVSGVILYDETIRQKTNDGKTIPELLLQKGIMPGIKVDRGTLLVPDQEIDTYTQGLDDLGKRLKEYKILGAVFAKWRAVITIGNTSPRRHTIERNAHDLALYAAICQENGIVPIVEPEVLMDGNHSMMDSKSITSNILEVVFDKLGDYGVNFGGMILKPNMITPNKNNLKNETPDIIAKTTLEVLRKYVPLKVPGIAFLSGGQNPEMATINLNAINKIKNESPEYFWKRITASYGRALQGEALEAWKGKAENTKIAQDIFAKRAEKVFKASKGLL